MLIKQTKVSWHLLSSSKIAEIGSSIFDGVAFVGFPRYLSFSKIQYYLMKNMWMANYSLYYGHWYITV